MRGAFGTPNSQAVSSGWLTLGQITAKLAGLPAIPGVKVYFVPISRP
jgi:hypothetical protein